jgi:hypothetical protein
MVLDRPFIDKSTLEEITSANTFSLKEMSIAKYNECHVNLAVLLIIDYCKNTKQNLVIQIHRGSSAVVYIKFLVQMLEMHYGEVKNEEITSKFPTCEFDNGFKLKLTNGYAYETLRSYPGYDIVLSLSLMGGLSPNFETGTMTLPSYFIPFDTKNRTIDLTKTTKVSNYLNDVLDDVLSIDQSKFFHVVNSFKSENKDKHFEAEVINVTHFKRNVKVLQIDGLYNPKESEFESTVTVISTNNQTNNESYCETP